MNDDIIAFWTFWSFGISIFGINVLIFFLYSDTFGQEDMHKLYVYSAQR